MAATLRTLDAQTLTDWELIVVDDASHDDPSQLVAELLPGRKWRVIRHRENKGPSAARNTGISSARGDFVAFLDSDDYWLPAKLETQLRGVERESRPEQVLSMTRTRVLMGKNHVRELPRRPPQIDEDCSEFLYVNHGFAQTSSFFLHRASADRIRFAESLRQYEDHLFFLAAGASGMRLTLCDEPLTIWRNDDRDDRTGRIDSLERAERYLDTAGNLLTPKARLAFRARYLGSLLFRKHPLGALRLFQEAYRAGAIGSRDLVTLALRCALPARQYAALRQAIMAGSGLCRSVGKGSAYAFECGGETGQTKA
jgi:glycosyltransferase involved in cell wall biosynthesis